MHNAGINTNSNIDEVAHGISRKTHWPTFVYNNFTKWGEDLWLARWAFRSVPSVLGQSLWLWLDASMRKWPGTSDLVLARRCRTPNLRTWALAICHSDQPWHAPVSQFRWSPQAVIAMSSLLGQSWLSDRKWAFSLQTSILTVIEQLTIVKPQWTKKSNCDVDVPFKTREPFSRRRSVEH